MITVERRESPRMPVVCGECVHAIPSRYPELVHCYQGVCSVVRSREVCRLCEDFAAFDLQAIKDGAPARSEARTDAPPLDRAAVEAEKIDQRRSSTADQSQIRDFARVGEITPAGLV